MRRRPVAIALLFAAAIVLGGCLQIGPPTKTQDFVVSPPWHAPETAHYALLDRDNGKEIGQGTLSVTEASGQYELSLKFQDKADYDNSAVLVDKSTLKPDSVHRDRSVDGKKNEITAKYDSTQNVVTITEIKSSGNRDVPHRLLKNYYDNDSSLYLWRAVEPVIGFKMYYHTVVTGSGEQQLVHYEVKGKDTVEVPAGKFECWRIEIRANGVKQVVWYADTPERPLIQYDNSLQLFQLTSLT